MQKNVRLLIFLFGFCITICSHILINRHYKSEAGVQNVQTQQMVAGLDQAQQWEKWHQEIASTLEQHHKHPPPQPSAPKKASEPKKPISDPSQGLPPGSKLHELIGKALQYVRTKAGALCVMEVGTADGRGTTVQLVGALTTYTAATG
eukprot:CAMPEP_0181339240 /NCGR_PEP_ID=MMETSP1101-20121128/29131_1 /TAXON_ID=46948 /ORGANISM="Rhodomonas abbreviata, Strain Caron Lab Isolate" /LENGTH=147 /DNA_ID=CAMNT_0023450157 /DNA_START=123 /DNA_END=563 /DNA_ORIENTATION=+